ncbi:MAG: hypothetical protein Q8N62_03815 [Candidatus Omnitrophota bacterium]|nr:hypothetical protein [Candidatus Omnitrophota bacterium]
MPNIFQYVLIASIILIVVLVYAFKYRDGFWFLFNFLLRPKTFAALSAKRAVEKECKSNISFKENCEKNEKWKNEQLARFDDQFFKSTHELRDRICFAFITVVLTLACALGVAYIAADLISISSIKLSIIQVVSAFLLMWAIIGQLGYSIQTIGGESMPEIIDKFWFIILNIVGIFSLFFAQFYSFFKK